ncbi:unnamed protein product [Prorocentrum cordatum]|uniref:Alpha/beta hydrolase fold-3 domain-containing protein n=2 Tax=Prorocentrum cordatum TaxID=2364126 RepID=A0ABN9SNM7_9DINO|nr:unnamed protein product [Polarella glacialis]
MLHVGIVKDPECCTDELLASGASPVNVTRPGTHWHCDDYYYDDDAGSDGGQGVCYDSLKGPRGTDQMWVPDGATCASPRMLYIHGGSWMYGSPFTTGYPQLASRLAAATGAVVLLPDYPLVPVGNYTSILRHAIEALRWLADHGPHEGCSSHGSAPLFVGGDSSGGGSALSLVLQLQADPDLLPGVRIAGAFFFSPWTNLMCNTPEYYHHAFARISDAGLRFEDYSEFEQFTGDILFQSVSLESSSDFNGNAIEYIGGNASLQVDPIASPYFAPPQHFAGNRTPALFFAVGDSESIMGDTVRVANAAGRAGADVTVEIHSGMWHVFPMYSEGCGSGSELWAGAHVINATGAFVRRVAAGRLEPVGDRRPRLHYLYSPNLDRFEETGELLPYTVPGREMYHQAMKSLSRAPMWAVVLSFLASGTGVFLAGCACGGLCVHGGQATLRRGRRVATYRAENGHLYTRLGDQGALQRKRTFLEDFVQDVPSSSRF